MRNRQSGFTIIELIVVIALLGILSAVALPRFINVTDEAHTAAVQGAGAGFSTGLALLKAQVVANGDLGGTDVDNVQGYGNETLDVNTNGYPVSTIGANGDSPAAASDCANVWEALFDANGPTVSTATTTVSGLDFQAAKSGDDCQYTYRVAGTSARTITYTASTGSASVSAD